MLRLCSSLDIPRTGFTIQIQVAICAEGGEEFSLDVVLNSQSFKTRKASWFRRHLLWKDLSPLWGISSLQPPPPASSKTGYSRSKDMPTFGQPGPLWAIGTFHILMSYLLKLLQVDLLLLVPYSQPPHCSSSPPTIMLLESTSLLSHYKKLNMIIINMETLQNHSLTIRNTSDKPKLRDIL